MSILNNKYVPAYIKKTKKVKSKENPSVGILQRYRKFLKPTRHQRTRLLMIATHFLVVFRGRWKGPIDQSNIAHFLSSRIYELEQGKGNTTVEYCTNARRQRLQQASTQAGWPRSCKRVCYNCTAPYRTFAANASSAASQASYSGRTTPSSFVSSTSASVAGLAPRVFGDVASSRSGSTLHEEGRTSAGTVLASGLNVLDVLERGEPDPSARGRRCSVCAALLSRFERVTAEVAWSLPSASGVGGMVGRGTFVVSSHGTGLGALLSVGVSWCSDFFCVGREGGGGNIFEGSM